MTADATTEPLSSHHVDQLAMGIVDMGRKMQLPYIAATADISSPVPMLGCDGRPYAETIFPWLDPELTYWKDPAFALRSGYILAVRHCAEPFYSKEERLDSWRSIAALETINESLDYDQFGIAGALVCPCHAANGVIGAIVWATDDETIDMTAVFDEWAESAHILTLKFLSSYRELHASHMTTNIVELTRREIHCLNWAAAGKTDSEIAIILDVSRPTIRFHLSNVYCKLGASGRAQAVRLATNLGYVGERVR